MEIPQELIEQFARGNGVLFVGAGVSLGAGLPDWNGLMERLKSEIENCPPRASHTDIAQYYILQNSRNRLVSRLRNELNSIDLDPTLVHSRLISLGASSIFTTNFDNLLEKALERGKIKYSKVISSVDSSFWTSDHVQLVKLHGDLDLPESLVITSSDYEKYFTAHPALTRILAIALQTRTVLLVGYSVSDIDFKFILTQVQDESGAYARKAFALMFDAPELVIKDMEFRGIKVINIVSTPDETEKMTDHLNGKLASWLDEFSAHVHQYRLANKKSLLRKRAQLPSEPYKFLQWFGADDRAIFHGRDDEIEMLSGLVITHQVSVLYGESGTGKTSLVRAGLIPRLRDESFITAYVRLLSDPHQNTYDALVSALNIDMPEAENFLDLLYRRLPENRPLLIVFDQFEEFFIRQGIETRRNFNNDLHFAIKRNKDIHVLFVLRSDYLGKLDEIEQEIRQDPLRYRMRLHNLGLGGASLAISRPAEDFKITIESALLDILLNDLEQGGIAPSQLQIVCFVLWRDWLQQGKPEMGFTLSSYNRLGTTHGILTDYLENVIRELNKDEIRKATKIGLDSDAAQSAARAVLKAMITSEQTKLAISAKEINRAEILLRLKISPADVEALISYLQNRRIIRYLPDNQSYELAHEVLIKHVWEWVSEEEKRILDLQDMLARAVSDYQKYNILLSVERISILAEQANLLQINQLALELIFVSSIYVSLDTKIWIERMDSARVIEILDQLLKTENRPLFVGIARSFGYTGSEEAIPYLEDLLKEKKSEIERAAAAALGNLRLSAASALLFRTAMKEDRISRVAPLLDALEVVHTDEAAAHLIIIAYDHSNPGVRRRAIASVLRWGHPAGIQLAIKQIESQDLAISDYALQYLRAMLEREHQLVSRLVRDEDPLVRISLAKGLIKVGNQAAIQILGEMLSDRAEIKALVLNALGEMGNTEAVMKLVRRSANTRLEEHKTVIEALGKAIQAVCRVKNVDALWRLIDLYFDAKTDENTRVYTLGAIRMLYGNPFMSNALLNGLQADDSAIASRSKNMIEVLSPRLLVLEYAKLLKHKDKRVRQQALEFILDSDVDVHQKREYMTLMLNDPSAAIRMRAIEALGQFGDSLSLEKLSEAITSEEIQRAERDAAFLNGQSDGVSDSIESYDDATYLEKYREIIALLEARNRQHITGRGGDPRIKLRIIKEFAKLGKKMLKRLQPRLIKIFEDGEYDQKLIAGIVLATNDVPMGTDLLIDELPKVDPILRIPVIDALSYTGDPRVVPLLLEALRNADPETKKQIIRSLGKTKNEQCVPAFMAALHDTEYGIQYEAMLALGMLGNSDAIEALSNKLDTADKYMALQIAHDLLALGQALPSTTLVTLVGSFDAAERVKAINLLAQPESKSIIPVLLVMLKDDDADVRHAAVCRLRRKPVEDFSTLATISLINALQDNEITVRRSAALTLANLCDPLRKHANEIMDALSTVVYSADSELSKRAQVTLNKYKQLF
jgi:HEAT repeat protein